MTGLEIIAVVTAFGTGLAAYKWIVPLLLSIKKDKRDEKKDEISIETMETDLRIKNISTYENQLEFLNNRIQLLQTQLTEITNNFFEIRKEYVALTDKYYLEQVENNRLRQYTCIHFETCQNKDKQNVDK